nr:chromatin accessibility complex protein 1 isoform X1 [Desmodus rotundus]
MALPIWARGSWDRLSLFLSRAVGPLQPQLLEPFPRWCFQRLVQSATFPPASAASVRELRLCLGRSSTPSLTTLDGVEERGPVQELFVQYLATYSYRHGSGKERKALTYSDLSNTAEESETFQFLADILPKKILASKYLKMLKEKREEDEEDDNSDESDDDEAES